MDGRVPASQGEPGMFVAVLFVIFSAFLAALLCTITGASR
jgi:hypothetical protein